MEDKLDKLLNAQQTLQEKLGFDIEAFSKTYRTEYIKEYVLHTEHEMHEMLQELPYFKAWKKYPSGDNLYQQNYMMDRARDEWIDVLHFFLNVTLALGFTAESLTEMYMQKNQINHARQEDTDNYKPCVED